jgi:hypothetical protein
MKRLSLSVAVLLGVSTVAGSSIRDQKFHNHLAQLKSKQSGDCDVEEANELSEEDLETIQAIASDSGLSDEQTEAFVALA